MKEEAESTTVLIWKQVLEELTHLTVKERVIESCIYKVPFMIKILQKSGFK